MPPSFQYTDSRSVSRLIAPRLDLEALLLKEVGPAFGQYRREWEEARSFRRQPAFPLHIDYEMKFKCNLRCPMCLMSLPLEGRRKYGRPEAELSAETVRGLLVEGSARGQKAMGFGGLWEPLLSPDLPDLISFARSRGLVDVMFNTNALLLTEKTGRALIEAGLTRLMISLDADTAATYAKMRVGSDFETVCANIENFIALRSRMGRALPVLRLSFCRTALNEHELEPFLKRWHGKVDFFSLQAYGRYESAAPPGYPEGVSADPPSGRCAQPHKRLLVRHNGQVLPCCDASGLSLVLGDIHTQSLDQIWAGPKLAALREKLAQDRLSGPAGACLACQTKFQPLNQLKGQDL